MNYAETILTGLSKYNLYDKLNEKEKKSEHLRYCSNVEHLDSKYKGIRELCSLFARNLINLDEILSDEDDRDERCRYFTLWIHDSIRKNFSIQWNDPDVNTVIRKFFSLLSTVKSKSKTNNCKYEYVKENTLDSWKNWKDLYDFIKNYNEIQNKINSNDISCPIYLEYYQYIEGIYKVYKQDCCNNNNPKCPFPNGSNPWCQQTDTLPKLECNKVNPVESAYTEAERAGTVERSAQDGVSYSVASPLPAPDQDETGDMVNNSDYYSKLGVSLPFLGILSTFVYLYNFTTFGTRIRSKLLRKSKTNLNLDDDAQHLLQHDSENTDLNIYNDDFNINYHSS
ncbi:PIR Superfamily Protein [Plasmodium ovale wallikeri]|uniref:PIR Superfamily Protein n=1 Tax=Plasmodium ovale wallikeri TaxID=864142 RepID=A0A1A9AN78_PLAOA|nr:PIR Superfamily Protein [Plasmodium ovale wallikeri]